MVILREELSKSKTGKHAVRDIALLVNIKTGEVKPLKPRKKERTKPVYRRGEAYTLIASIPENHVAVQVHLVKNLQGHVKGFIEIYSREGVKLYRAVYRKLKLRYSCGDTSYAWIVELVAKKLKLPFKNSNLTPASKVDCR